MILLLACVAPIDVQEIPAPRAERSPFGLDPRQTLAPLELGGPVREARPLEAPVRLRDQIPRRSALPTKHLLSDTLNTILFAEPSDAFGQALEDKLDSLSASDRRNYGMTRLTLDEVFGTADADYTNALCEVPRVDFSFEDEGVTWDARFEVPPHTMLTSDLYPYTLKLWQECIDGIAAAGGDGAAAVASGDCLDVEYTTFFLPGTSCGDCVGGNGGDYPACVDAGSCEEEVQAHIWLEQDGEGDYYDWYTTTVWACAPDEIVLASVFAKNQEDGSLPEPWDHEGWAMMCPRYWNDDVDGPWWYCPTQADGLRHGGTMAGGVGDYVDYLRPEGSDVEGWKNLIYYADMMEVSGNELTWGWAHNPGSGAVSNEYDLADTNGDGAIDDQDACFGFGCGYSFGLDPRESRPDGESQVRDWLGTVVMKASTTINGISISVANHNRCAADAWKQAPDGSFHCTRTEAPERDWLEDGEVYLSASGATVNFGATTLASTGLPDPAIPGGYVIHIAGGPVLADQDWEDCALPNQFVPDTTQVPESPGDWDGPQGLTVQTVRFDPDGGAPDQQLRVALNTNMYRGWCTAGAP